MRKMDAWLSRWAWGRQWILQRRLPLSFPFTLNIEPTDHCDCACAMCPRSSGGTHMAETTFEKIMMELEERGGVERLYLHKFGEPLLHPHIDDLVRRAKAFGACRRLILTTNGRSLTPDLSRRLILAGLDEIKFSIDAVSEEGYRKVKGVPGLVQVEANVMAFLQERERAGSSRPVVKVKMLPLKITQHEISGFRSRWRGVADEVLIERLIHYGGRWQDLEASPETAVERFPCTYLWYTLVVNAEGSISVCCADHAKQGCVGHVKEGLLSAWQGESLRSIRRSHLEGRFDFEPCRTCSYWRSRENIGAWLRNHRDTVL